ncbi:MAG: Rieske 2Fe-2S domain-containing protein, partial [Firmicutes bacterium]|nr:Rieske 2Fe-2S domain-containing protein [Bacillota bacterium]
LRDLLLGRENAAAQLFDPARSILKPQLLVNAAESTLNLLTPTTRRCPHLGCALKWNEAEQSWDCPCHGSRFTKAGKLINNPANHDWYKAPRA